MNELFDQLILRIVFTFFICLVICFYKNLHAFLYPSLKIQSLKKFYPSSNSAYTLHFFSRLIGIGIIFSGLYFNIKDGILSAIITFFIQSLTNLFLYLLSIYILESITLFNFEYNNEVIKRKNLCYTLISFSQAISLAFIVNSVMMWENHFQVEKFFSWLFSIVIFGVMTKFFKILSKLSFNQLIIHKNLSLAISYSGYLFGATVIIISAFGQELVEIEIYTIRILLKIILSAIIFPLFKIGLIYIFKIQSDIHILGQTSNKEENNDYSGPGLGYGIYEGAIFFTSCFLTSIITGHIPFESFYQHELDLE